MPIRQILTRFWHGPGVPQKIPSVIASQPAHRQYLIQIKVCPSSIKFRQSFRLQGAIRPHQQGTTRAAPKSTAFVMPANPIEAGRTFEAGLEVARAALLRSSYRRKLRQRGILYHHDYLWYRRGFEDGVQAQHLANQEETQRFRKWGRRAYIALYVFLFGYGMKLGKIAYRELRGQGKEGAGADIEVASERDVGRDEGREAGVVGLEVSANET